MYGPGSLAWRRMRSRFGGEALHLLAALKPSARQTEDPHARLGQRVALGESPTDGVVLGEDHPVIGAGIAKPHLVWKSLSYLLSIDRRHRVHDQSVSSEALSDALAEAAVDEELGRSVHRVRLSNAVPGLDGDYAAACVATRMTSSTSVGGTPKSSAISAMLSPA